MKPPVFGVAGWKNSGKTTLLAQLIEEFTRRGYKVGAIKHAHHGFDMDQPGRDSYRFREAGAQEIAVVSARRVAILQELRDEPEPGLDDMIERLQGSDIILVEGFKRNAHPKIEARREEAMKREALAGNIEGVVAVAANYEAETGGLPLFRLDDVTEIADFITRYTGLNIPA